MTLRAEAHTPPVTEVRRFGPVQRWVHRTTAALMGVCVVTAAFLYVPEFAELVGRRELVVRVHECAGLALPVPVLVGLASRHFRADLGHLNRCAPPCAGTSGGRSARRRSSTRARRSTPPGSRGPRW
jgi:formate dehydrogenase subunit gamma